MSEPDSPLAPRPHHYSVMVPECLEYLDIQPNGVYADLTCGLGGHTGAIARKLAQWPDAKGLVLGCDRDAESLALAKQNTADVALRADGSARIQFHQVPFSLVGETLAAQRIKTAGPGFLQIENPSVQNAEPAITQLDGALADLGVSRYQLTDGERGFSLMADGPLDARMDRSQGQTAADLVNYESEKALADLIYELGEERRSRRIARAIVRARPITTTGELAALIESVAPRTGKIHGATKTFLALRIAVNGEREELDELLKSLPQLVKPGGRVVILTFMSIEDRQVKQAFQALAKAGRARILTRHVVRPSEEEVEANPPSRSAKLRALEML